MSRGKYVRNDGTVMPNKGDVKTIEIEEGYIYLDIFKADSNET